MENRGDCDRPRCERTCETINGKERHVYAIKTLSRRIDRSVTAHISQAFFGEFDGKSVAEKMVSSPGWSRNRYKTVIDQRCESKRENSKERSICAMALLDVWRETREKGVDLHAYIETYLQSCRFGNLRSAASNDDSCGTDNDKIESPANVAFQASLVSPADRIAVQECFRYIFQHLGWSVHATEMVVYDEDANLAGTVDAVFRDDVNDTWVLFDWKRSKVNALAYRCIDLDRAMSSYGNAPYWRYTFQLNFYKLILQKKYGFRKVDMYVVSFPPDSGTFEIFGVPNVLHLKDHYDQLVEEERQSGEISEPL